MKIAAAVSRGPAVPFVIDEVEIADPAPGQVLVRLVATGVCHTDLAAKAMLPSELGPIILGHEGAGVVERVGEEVVGVVAGDRVILTFSSCGMCQNCSAQLPAYCARFGELNGPSFWDKGSPVLSDGAAVTAGFFGQSSFATHSLVDVRNVVVVDPDLDLTMAAPLGCGIQTGAGAVLNVLRPAAESTVLVVGAGSVGLAAVMAAKVAGARVVIAVDPVATRRQLALEIGATHVVDPGDGDVVAAVIELTGSGASHAIDTTGSPQVIAQAMRALAPLGTLVVVGLGQDELTLSVQDVLNHGKTLRGCIEGDANPQQFIPQLISLYRQGRFPMDKLIGRYAFEQINEAVSDSASGATVKPVLVF